jgi:hypothetical protein
MIARVWHGVVPQEKAEGYGKYLADSDRGVRDYQRLPGNRGVCLMRRAEGERVHFLLISFRDSREAIQTDTIGDISLPFPSRAGQEAIVQSLDRETAEIDAFITKVRTAIDRLKGLRTALISAAVTGKIDVREVGAA